MKTSAGVVPKLRSFAICSYHGTKNHHNFTVGKKPIDKSAIRYIMSFKATELFEVDGMVMHALV